MSAARAEERIEVYLEVGQKRVFASAADWPGWCRPGKTEELALQALGDYAPRYRPVAAAAGQKFPASTPGFVVVERLPGSATTEYGAPGAVAGAEASRLTRAEAARLADILEAAWAKLDRVVESAPAELRKGPRGGGRDRDQVVAHVLSAEPAYAGKMGIKEREPDPADRAAVAAMHGRIIAAVRQATGQPTLEGKGWPPRYVVRRTAWHALDHAWEIEDRS